MEKQRIRQVNELLRTVLAAEFSRELELPHGVVVSISRVSTSSDLHNANVFVSVVPEEQTGTVLAQIKKQLPHIIHAVGPRLVLKNVPKFKIVVDAGERKAARIDELLDSLRKNE